jgi:hypothetical protein
MNSFQSYFNYFCVTILSAVVFVAYVFSMCYISYRSLQLAVLWKRFLKC